MVRIRAAGVTDNVMYSNGITAAMNSLGQLSW
jgi:hypothetical protein